MEINFRHLKIKLSKPPSRYTKEGIKCFYYTFMVQHDKTH